MLNKIVIMGRLTRDPEYRTTGSGTSVVNFSVAVDRDYPGQSGEKETDFIDCVAWKHTAEFVAKYFTKGSMIVVFGRLQIRNWTDKDGGKRRAAEVMAESIYFGESKRAANANTVSTGPASYSQSPAIAAHDFVLLDGPDEQLPF